MDSFWQWWQHLPERIDPVFFQLGSVQIRYYGLMYFTSFLVAYTLLLYRAKKEKGPFTKNIVEDYATWAIIGVLLGSRLGYVLFYNLGYFWEHPLEIFLPFQTSAEGFQYTGISGMSYHGGLIGVTVATIWFCRKMKLNVLGFGDFLVSAVPLGYMFGRIGNFLNRIKNAPTEKSYAGECKQQKEWRQHKKC